MKTLTLFLFCAAACFFMGCPSPEPKPDPVSEPDFYTLVSDTKAGYDSIFAKKLTADGYGMNRYVMAFLKEGPNRNMDSLAQINLQKAHLKNIIRMANEGKLVIAGPFLDDGPVRGIYIFNVKTIEEARALTATDPAIQAGSLEMELRPWYGSAALPLVTPLHKRLEKNSVAD